MEILLLVIGSYYTWKSGFFSLRRLGTAFCSIREKPGNSGKGITVFSSLCTNLAASLGTGNIIGVAAAVMSGGAGALFWMIVAAILGMTIKFAENMLAAHYCRQSEEGIRFGGPFIYLSDGCSGKFGILAPIFCVGCMLSGILGMGTVTQANSISLAICSLTPNAEHTTRIVVACIVTMLAAAVILGGGYRIARISECLIPAASLVYLLICSVILVRFRAKIPWALQSICRDAFCIRSAGGAVLGVGMTKAIQVGIRRGIFSNEAGLGTSAITAAAAEGSPMEQGYAGIVSVFIDTVLLCTLTGLCVLVTDAASGAETPVEAAIAVMNGLPLHPGICNWIFSFMLSIFAFSTILGWNFYAERSATWLFQNKTAVIAYQCLYLAAVFCGPFLSVEFAWRAADIMNWLMAVPNLIALWVLRREVLCHMK